MTTSVSLGSRQPWITGSHWASQWRTSRNNSKAAKLLHCLAMHHTTETGQSYLAHNYFTSTEETPYQPRPQIRNPRQHFHLCPVSVHVCTCWMQGLRKGITSTFFSCQCLYSQWQQNAIYTVDETGLKKAETINRKRRVPRPTTQTR